MARSIGRCELPRSALRTVRRAGGLPREDPQGAPRRWRQRSGVQRGADDHRGAFVRLDSRNWVTIESP